VTISGHRGAHGAAPPHRRRPKVRRIPP
jgi:hypothetical protein